MQIEIEVTDTFGGEANYAWVKRVTLEVPEGTSDTAMMRRIKKAIGWSGIRCTVDNLGDELHIRPSGMCQVCFVNFYSF